MPASAGRTALLTALALTAFAANSILCRQALGARLMDPASFTGVRLGSGALALWVATGAQRPVALTRAGSWGSALALFAYAAAFSLAYLDLTAGTGALILFGAVQVSMLLWGLRGGERPHAGEWTGLLLAVAGLGVLVRPGLAAPAPVAAALMAVAGIAWGAYSLRGRSATTPLQSTAGNFLRTIPLVGLFLLPNAGRLHVTPGGLALAVASGALASGAGYAVWYAALPSLSATRAALVQLLVPVLAAVAGVVVLGEPLPARLPVAAALVLGGVALAVTARGRARGRA